jgi:hypothetical protein
MECPQTGEGGWRNQIADGGLERMAPCHGLPMRIAAIWGDVFSWEQGSPPFFFLNFSLPWTADVQPTPSK